ncbi:hypothetical protein B0H19DRAFT_1122635 [Mycena capillaripes]|nr:hypothetical protein B0H19DRAFT_1122635 [Mycena capillaripes]
MTQPTGILDLPTEILVNILEHPTFPTNTIYALALLCRRLHFIALPIYLSRHGFTPASNSVVIAMEADRPDLLTALQTALFTPQTARITCIFPHPSCTSIFPLLSHLQRLENYVSRLPSVEQVTLHLDTKGSACLCVGDDPALRAWVGHLESLLNCIVGKQCSSLTMLHGGQFTRAYEVVRPVARTSPLQRLLSALLRRNETQVFRRAPHQGPMRIEMGPCHRSSKLTSLEIQSAILMVPPGLRWTLTAFRNCPITSLTLGRGVEEPIIWRVVLPLIASAARRITSLTLVEAEFLSDGDILDFVARLPRLRHLTISSRNQTELRQPERAPPIPLRSLEILRAPPRLIQPLLRHPSPVPKIKYIYLLWPEVYIAHNIDVFTSTLSTMLRTLDAHGRAPRIIVSVNTMMYRAASLTHHHPTGELRMFLDRIDTLEITAVPFFFTDIPDMVAWIALFRRVKRVEITLSTLPFAEADFEQDVARLVGAIKATELLDKVTVNGETYELVKG